MSETYLTKDEGAFLLSQINYLHDRVRAVSIALTFFVIIAVGALLVGCSSPSTPAPIAQLEPVTTDTRQPIERLGVCEEVFYGDDVENCYVVLSMVDKIEEGQ